MDSHWKKIKFYYTFLTNFFPVFFVDPLERLENYLGVRKKNKYWEKISEQENQKKNRETKVKFGFDFNVVPRFKRLFFPRKFQRDLG